MIGRRILTLSLVLFVCACGRIGTPQEQTYESIDDLLIALEDAGAEIVIVVLDEPLFDVDSQAIMLNGEKSELYEFGNAEERERGVIHLQTVLEDGRKNTADELSSARIWSHDRLVVVYFGRDGWTTLLLSGLLGDPLQKPALADDAPYPPAIPAAIHALAEAKGEDPSLIKVLSYTFVEWNNGCLEYPHPDEVCTQALIPGWRILLQLGDQSLNFIVMKWVEKFAGGDN